MHCIYQTLDNIIDYKNFSEIPLASLEIIGR